MEIFNKHVRTRNYTQEIVDRYLEISFPAYENIGAPRVGFDKAADDWMLQHYAANKQEDETEVQFLERMKGYYALDVLKNCDGIPRYRAFGGEAYIFRGQFSNDLQEELGELYNKAYEYLNAEELVTYGKEIMDLASEYATQHQTEFVKGDTNEEGVDEGPAYKTHLLRNFGRWCLFWGKKGHGMGGYPKKCVNKIELII